MVRKEYSAAICQTDVDHLITIKPVPEKSVFCSYLSNKAWVELSVSEYSESAVASCVRRSAVARKSVLHIPHTKISLGGLRKATPFQLSPPMWTSELSFIKFLLCMWAEPPFHTQVAAVVQCSSQTLSWVTLCVYTVAFCATGWVMPLWINLLSSCQWGPCGQKYSAANITSCKHKYSAANTINKQQANTSLFIM